jgi:DNA polymerase I-like protein with 3'-5' exonuclease and polymerase domains
MQNTPKRDEIMMDTCRGALFPRPGHQLLEVDFSALEVKVIACYSKDTTLLKYINDEKSDMHGDMAKQVFLLDALNKKIPEHKILRNAVKNGFVFPEFYGDYYKNCTRNIAIKWCKLHKGKWKKEEGIKMPDGFVSDLLISKGIKSYESFEDHIKTIEGDFQNNRFYEHMNWLNRWYKKYLRRGYIDTYTGFRCGGLMSRNEIANYHIQGSAFHILLKTLILLDTKILQEKWDSKIISQIHDSLIIDTNPKELNLIIETIQDIIHNQLIKIWPWIIVPLEVEADLAEVDQSWAKIKSYPLP